LKPEEFVAVVKLRTSDAAVKGSLKTLERPPGRSPSERLLNLSRWYNQLSEEDRHMLGEAFREVAESAIFGFFCILDGVRVIEDTTDKGELELYFVKGSERTLLNDPHLEELHNVFNALRSKNDA
jgi:hypothetical protein